jgi:hypothetical protein
VALSLIHRSDSRVPAARSSSRHALHLLASAWQGSKGEQRQVPTPMSTSLPDASRPVADAAEPPYWPDGPSAA